MFEILSVPGAAGGEVLIAKGALAHPGNHVACSHLIMVCV